MIINRITIGFLFAIIYQIVVGMATSILSIPLTGNISDLFLGIHKADSEGILLIVWWIVSTILITGIALLIVKYKLYFSPYRGEQNIEIPPKITVITAIVIGSIISFMFFLMDTITGISVGTTSADVQAISEAAGEGNYIPLYLSMLFSILTGFAIVAITGKISRVKEITKDIGLQDITGIKHIMNITKAEKTLLSDTIGQSPGALIHVGERKVEDIRIDMIEYDAETITEATNVQIEDCLKSKNEPNVTWINVIGIHDPKIMELFGNSFEIHPLHQANIMNTELRPSIEVSDNYLLIMLKMPHYDSDTGDLDLEQISIILGENHVITFQEIEADFFDQIRKRLRSKSGTIRDLKSDYLTYAIIDAIIDSYFLVIETTT